MKSGKINMENYEAYLLDYMEGHLSKENTGLLLEFVVLHPELNIHLNELESLELIAESIAFENKNTLKKTATQLVADEQYIEYIENNLNTEEKKRIENLCAAYPAIEKELNLYKKTILIPDANELFENKNSLKKEAKIIYLFSRQSLSVAAAIILLLGLVILFNYFSSNDTSNQVSENKFVPVTTNTQNTENKNPVTNNSTDTLVSVIENNTPLHKQSNQIKNVHEKANTENAVAANPAITNTLIAPINNQSENTIQPVLAVITNTVPASIKNESTNSEPFVITEKAFDEDEKTVVASAENKSIWKKARKAIRGLNKMGVKAVNASETTNTNSEQYLVTLGNFSIEKNKYNQE